MKRKRRTISILEAGSRLVIAIMAMWMMSINVAQAQCTAINEAFLPGEKIEYDLYFNWKFIWKKVGTASMKIDAANYNNKPGYVIDLLTKGSKQADFFFKMRDTLTCYVSEQLEPLYFRKAAEEGKRHTVDEAWFSYKDGVSHVKQRRTWRSHNRPTQEMEYSDSRCIFDMLSILAQARSYDPNDYKVGDKINFPMATGRKVPLSTICPAAVLKFMCRPVSSPSAIPASASRRSIRSASLSGFTGWTKATPRPPAARAWAFPS